MDRRGTGGDSEWRDQCRQWTGNRNGRCGWQGVSLEVSRKPRPGWWGGGKRESGHRVRTERGVGPGGTSIATGLGRKPVGGCYSAEMARPVISSTAHDPILSYILLLLLMHHAASKCKKSPQIDVHQLIWWTDSKISIISSSQWIEKSCRKWKKSGRQKQIQDKVHKCEERIAQSTGQSHVSIGTGMSAEANTAKNSCDKTLGLSSSGEVLGRNSPVVDSATGNVRSAQEKVDKYLESQKGLARRFNKKYSYTKEGANHSIQKAAIEMFDRSSDQSKDKRQ